MASEEEEVVVDEPTDETDTVTEFVPQHVLDGGRDYRVLDDDGNPQDVSGYLGVDPEYMTYASDTHKPYLTDAERYDFTNQYDHLEGNAEEESVVAEESIQEGAPKSADEAKSDDEQGEGLFV
jgi:hypothetical protein